MTHRRDRADTISAWIILIGTIGAAVYGTDHLVSAVLAAAYAGSILGREPEPKL